jgi:hypothetical protein
MQAKLRTVPSPLFLSQGSLRSELEGTFPKQYVLHNRYACLYVLCHSGEKVAAFPCGLKLANFSGVEIHVQHLRGPLDIKHKMNFVKEMVGAVAPHTADLARKNATLKRQQEANLSTTMVPFSPPRRFDEDLSPDRSIMEVIVDMDITNDQFRSSTQLKEVINEVVSSISLFHCWGKQSIKVRLRAFVKLLVCQLCVPHIMTLYGVGTTLFGGDKNGDADLVSRGKRILVEAFTLFKLAEESLLDCGEDACLDKRRFHLFILLMELKCSPFLSHGLTIREHGASALEAMSCHILGVTAVTQCVHESIKIVVARLTNVLTGETTNTTIDATRAQLELIVLDYFAWLRGNAEQLTRMCRREEILTAVDASTRAWLKGETYSSPLEILSVYHQKYKEKLTHMAIPLQPYRHRDLEQARKDLLRETVVLNNVLYIGGNCAAPGLQGARTLHAMVRSELRKVLSYLFELDVFQGVEEGRGDDLDGTDIESSNSGSFGSLNGPVELKLAAYRTPKGALRKGIDSSSGSPRTIDESTPLPTESVSSSSSAAAGPGSLRNPGDGSSVVPSYWEYELLEALYSYTVLAASRTFAAGDAFLILNDLYGGEGLTLCPMAGPRIPSATGGASPMAGRSTNANSSNTLPRAGAAESTPPKPVIDASIAVLASGVKVTLRERYNLFVSDEMARCVDVSKLRPLMRFECTTTTLLVLNLQGEQGGVAAVALTESKRAACGRLFQTIISNPDHICHRAVTIEPFL